MNDKTSTPDEPDGRGPVVTGQQAAVPQHAGGAEAGVPNPATGPTDPSAQAANGGPAHTVAGAEVPPGAPPGTGEPPVSPAPGRAGSETATAEMRVPASSNGSAPVPGAPAEVPVPAPPGTTDAEQPGDGRPAKAPSPGPATGRPAPAPGPVPGPGPAAAPPPPWHRMPGVESQDQRDRREAPPEPRPAGGLLDEAPTTFLEAPGAPGATTTATQSEAPPKQEASGWGAVRAVRNRPPRQAALQLKRLDPWSALKLGLVLAVVLFFIWLVAVGVLYGVLDGMGVWDRLNGTYADLVSGQAPTGSPLISAGRVFGLAAVIGAINSLLFAVAVTVGAFVYNVSADLVGGIEVTLSERD